MNTVDMTASSNLKHIPGIFTAMPETCCSRVPDIPVRSSPARLTASADSVPAVRSTSPPTVSPLMPAVHAQKCFIIGKIVSETNRTTSPSSSCPKSMMRFPRNPISSPASP